MNKKALQSLIFASGLALGGIGTGVYYNTKSRDPHQEKDLSAFYDNVFDREFFGQERSPFARMEKMRREMDKVFDTQSSFDNWYGSKFGGDIGGIKQEEDPRSITYRIDLKGIDKSTLKTEVNQGQITISGESSSLQAEEEGTVEQRSETFQSFRRSFPVPAGVDERNVKIEAEDDELVIRFPKS